MNTFSQAHALFVQDAPRAYADLKPRQQTFVRMLHEAGATGETVRRQVVKSTHASDPHFPWPSWLTGDKTRRCNRGVFYIPELAEYIANIVDDPSEAPAATEVMVEDNPQVDVEAQAYAEIA